MFCDCWKFNCFYINVGGNKIMAFPTKIQVLNSLVYLNLDSINVNYFPTNIFQIAGLKSFFFWKFQICGWNYIIYIGNIAMTKIPSEFKDLTELHELFSDFIRINWNLLLTDIHGTSLAQFPTDSDLKDLKYLCDMGILLWFAI